MKNKLICVKARYLLLNRRDFLDSDSYCFWATSSLQARWLEYVIFDHLFLETEKATVQPYGLLLRNSPSNAKKNSEEDAAKMNKNPDLTCSDGEKTQFQNVNVWNAWHSLIWLWLGLFPEGRKRKSWQSEQQQHTANAI